MGLISSTKGSAYLQPGFNYLINPSFEVNQRGVSSITATANYVVDRWISYRYGGTFTVSQQVFAPGQTDVPGNPKNYVRYAAVTANTTSEYFTFGQAIEDVSILSGKTVTLSFWAKADGVKPIAFDYNQNFGSGGSSGVYAPIGKVILSTSWQRYTLIFTVPSISGKTIGSGNNFSVYAWMSAGSDYNIRSSSLGHQSGTFEFANIKLEEGSVATPFMVPRFGDELKKCQRYYERFAIGQMRFEGTGTVNICSNINFKVTKRVVPTINIYPSHNFSGTAGNVLKNNATTHGAASYIDAEGGIWYATGGISMIPNDYIQWSWEAIAEL